MTMLAPVGPQEPPALRYVGLVAVTPLRAGPSCGLPGQAPERRAWVKIQSAKTTKTGQDSTGVDTFLTNTDAAAVTAVAIEAKGKVEVVGVRMNTAWELAGRRLFAAHVDGGLTLLGRQAPHYTADPVGDIVPIPRTFFAGDVVLGLFNGIHDRRDPSRAIYREIKISTAEFSRVFPASIEPEVTTGEVTIFTRRQPRMRDAHEFVAWAEGLHSSRGYGPSRKEAANFARQCSLGREWSRSQYKALSPELRRERGGKGSATYQAKFRAPEPPKP